MILPYDLAKQSKSEFSETFKDLYECSPWVVNNSFLKIVDCQETNSLEVFHKILSEFMLDASEELQMDLIKSHPTLAGKKAKAGLLTDFSTDEQKSAGLNNCTDEEIVLFEKLNQEYKEKFGFPFIMAVKNKTKKKIIKNFEQRLNNNFEQEKKNALEQINQIAWLRIKEIYEN